MDWGKSISRCVVVSSVLAATSFNLGCSADGSGQGAEAVLSAALPADTEAETSTISFAMSKWMDAAGADRVAVNGTFKGITVSMDDKSRASLHAQDLTHVSVQLGIDLGSLDTGMDIRNTNVKETFFAVASFPTATVVVSDLVATQDPFVYTAKVALSAHGVTQQLSPTKISLEQVEHGYRVRTVEPVVIVSADFGFGVAALLARCMHKGLDASAKVQADVFVRE